MTTATAEQQGLAKRDDVKTPGIITTPQQYQDSMQRWSSKGFSVLTPFSTFSGIAPQHGMIATMIQINPNKDAGEVYDGVPWLKRGEISLAKNGLRKIEEALGISHRLEYITTQREERHYWHVKAICSYRGLDGAIVTREASQEWDLRDGSERMKGWTAAQIQEARKHGIRNCETRAINAAIKECGCGLKQKYTPEDLAKPFVAIRVAFQPDYSDPETRRMVTERALAGTSALYPPQALPAHEAIDVEPEHREPETVGRGFTASVTNQAASQTTAPATTSQPSTAASAAPEGYGLIKDLTVQELPRRKGGTFKKWTITDARGDKHVTISRDLGTQAEDCRSAGTPVRIVSEENSYNELEVREIIEHDPQQPSMLPPTSEL